MHLHLMLQLILGLTFAYRINLSWTRLNKEEMTIAKAKTSAPLPWPDIDLCFIRTDVKPAEVDLDIQMEEMVKVEDVILAAYSVGANMEM